eukprot:TRINITY_DN7499_c0_g1_i1.p1 TRINITY_DN7499_c0_g1~~TRINITY_DN7499_c0_g1_i1.p1  ORF type:complete len:1521 (+),score=597.74 TRINITY_DN7499_c0_g1_i1:65-4627(+)
MISFSAINEDRNDAPTRNQKIQKEAQEAENKRLYEKALGHLSKKNLQDADSIFSQILDSPLIKSLNREEGDDPLPLGDPSVMLKYLVLKNQAALRGSNGKEEESLNKYLEAARIDDSDPSIWFHIGSLAMKLEHLNVARCAFEKALILQPTHWPSILPLLKTLYLIGDLEACNLLCQQALAINPTFLTAFSLKRKLEEEDESLVSEGRFSFLMAKLERETNGKYEDLSELVQLREKRRKTVEQREELCKIKERKKELHGNEFCWNSICSILLELYEKSINSSRFLHSPLQLTSKNSLDLHPYNNNAISIDSNPNESNQSEVISLIDEDSSSSAATTPVKPVSKRKQAKKVEPRASTTRGDRSKRKTTSNSESIESQTESYFSKFFSPPREIEVEGEDLMETNNTKEVTTISSTGSIPKDLEKGQIVQFLQKMEKRSCGLIDWIQAFFVEYFALNSTKYRWNKSDSWFRLFRAWKKHSKIVYSFFLEIVEHLLDYAHIERNSNEADRLLDELIETAALGSFDEQFINNSEKERNFYARIYWWKAQIQNAKGKNEEYRAYLSLCKSQLMALNEAQNNEEERNANATIQLPHITKYDPISVQKIESLLHTITIDNEKKEARDFLLAKDYSSIELNCSKYFSVEIRNELGKKGASAKNPLPLEMLHVLQEAAKKMDKMEDVLKAMDLILIGANSYSSLNASLELIPLDETPGETISYESFNSVHLYNVLDNQLQLLSSLIDETEKKDLIDKWSDNLVDSLLSTLSKTMLRSGLREKENYLPSICCVLFYRLLNLKDRITEANSMEEVKVNQSQIEKRNRNVLAKMHSFLGQKQLCCYSSDFLKLEVRELAKAQNDEDEEDDAEEEEEPVQVDAEMAQCFFCLYRLKEGKGTKHINESHLTFNAAKGDDDPLQKLCTGDPFMLKIVMDFISKDKSLHRFIKKIETFFETPPAHLLYADSAVKRYLRGEMNGWEEPTPVEVVEDDNNFDFVYRMIFHLRTNVPPKTEAENLPKLVHLLHFDLAIEPNRVDSWFVLGYCYHLFYDRLLGMDPGNVVVTIKVAENNETSAKATKDDNEVAEYLKSCREKALRCFQRVYHLDPAKWEAVEEEALLQYTHFRVEKEKFAERISEMTEEKKISFYKKRKGKLEYLLRLFEKLIIGCEDKWEFPYFAGKIREKLFKVRHFLSNSSPPSSEEVYEFVDKILESYSEAKDRAGKESAEPTFRLHRLRYIFAQSGFSSFDLLARYPAKDPISLEGLNEDERRDAIVEDAVKGLTLCDKIDVDAHKHSYYLAMYYEKSNPVKAYEEINKIFRRAKPGGTVNLTATPLDRGGKTQVYIKKYMPLFKKLLIEMKQSKRTYEVASKFKSVPSQYKDLYRALFQILQSSIQTLRESREQSSGQQPIPSQAQSPIDHALKELSKDKDIGGILESSIDAVLSPAYLAYLDCKTTTKKENPLSEFKELSEQILLDAFKLEQSDMNASVTIADAVNHCEKKSFKKRRGGAAPKITETTPQKEEGKEEETTEKND